MSTSRSHNHVQHWGASGPAQANASSTQRSSKEYATMFLDLLTAVGVIALVQRSGLLYITLDPLSSFQTYPQQTSLLFGLLLIICGQSFNLYGRGPTGIWKEQLKLAKVCASAGLILSGGLILIHVAMLPEKAVELTLATFGLLGLRRIYCRLVGPADNSTGVLQRNVVVAGVDLTTAASETRVRSMLQLGFSFCGSFPDINASVTATDDNQREQAEACVSFARLRFADTILVSGSADQVFLNSLITKAEKAAIEVHLIVYDMREQPFPASAEYIGEFVTIPICRRRHSLTASIIKRSIDLVLSAIGLVLISPVFFVIAVAVKLSSAGPVFYRAQRVGYRGRRFVCYKFRSMVSDADDRRAGLESRNERSGVLFKIKHDPRITRVGRLLRRYSLDELPQLINVFSGEMSLVGPRPPTLSEVEQYEVHHLRRLDVKPGMTGLWQVEGRHDPSFESYISLDLAYIDHWSIWKDVHILARTVGAVLGGTGS